MLSGNGEISLVQSEELGDLIDSVVAGESEASVVDEIDFNVRAIQPDPPSDVGPPADTSSYA